MSGIENSTRRTFLKTAAATVGTVIASPTVKGTSTPDPVGLSGTERDPIQRAHVENARAKVLEGDSDRSGNTVALADQPVPEEGYLAGYAIAVTNGAPVERIHPVTEPVSVDRSGTFDPLAYRIRPFRAARANSGDADGQSTRSGIRTRREERAHRAIDRFLDDPAVSGLQGSIWSRSGTTTVERTIVIEFPDGRVSQAGAIELTVDLYERRTDSRDDESYIACAPRASITPGCQMDDADPLVNDRTVLTQRWSDNETGGHEITDWGPTTGKTGAIDWSHPDEEFVTSPDDAIASYSVDHIAREVDSAPNETVAHRFTYPTAFLARTTARDQRITVANYAEGWIDEADHRETMLTVELDQGVGGTRSVLGPIERDVSTDWNESAALSAYRL